MNKIAFAAAAFLIATGSAFAGSDHYNPNDTAQSAVTAPAGYAGNVDRTVTGSINKFEQRFIKSAPSSNQQESGQGLWGNH
ncbi:MULTISPECIES: DUF680 domain-containing protein [unclassified Mesorhizobium]|uniref:DUF680 domain-containing protein n=1 Tax=unclassified Mesorhizobium TaxID=325217 RepID=UPI00112CAE6F|nr:MULTISPECIES: DUF680 domain-containing protein [unclassified Mesorhizobium]TPK97407.1 DUF680 domain-containing protein [Mesorhizobium sp. B2-4-16]TPL63474.1 DUF680 domain-containing protein [Mesorhizobium sp. B2-4-3]